MNHGKELEAKEQEVLVISKTKYGYGSVKKVKKLNQGVKINICY